MTRRPAALCLALLLCAAAALPAVSADVPTPESVLGFSVGEDRKLADWTQIVGYFQKLAAASPRVKVEDVGPTTEGNPFLVVTITSEANMARLEEIRRANLRLADPRTLSEDEARGLIDTGKAIVALNHGIHSTEVGASQTSMQTAYALATGQDADTLDILDKTVILMLPSHNPDGTQKVVEWYRKSLGTPWEGGQVPFLYHKYTGHDNNRDWYMFTQVETLLTVKHVYDRWRPQIVHDLHQMGTRAARIFAPPYPLAGRHVAAPRHRRLPALRYPRRPRARRPQPRLLAEDLLRGEPARGRAQRAIRLHRARGAEGPARHVEALGGHAHGRGRG